MSVETLPSFSSPESVLVPPAWPTISAEVFDVVDRPIPTGLNSEPLAITAGVVAPVESDSDTAGPKQIVYELTNVGQRPDDSDKVDYVKAYSAYKPRSTQRASRASEQDSNADEVGFTSDVVGILDRHVARLAEANQRRALESAAKQAETRQALPMPSSYEQTMAEYYARINAIMGMFALFRAMRNPDLSAPRIHGFQMHGATPSSRPSRSNVVPAA